MATEVIILSFLYEWNGFGFHDSMNGFGFHGVAVFMKGEDPVIYMLAGILLSGDSFCIYRIFRS